MIFAKILVALSVPVMLYILLLLFDDAWKEEEWTEPDDGALPPLPREGEDFEE